MNKQLQLDKIFRKLGLVSNIVEDLTEQNNTKGYKNTKKIKAVIDYKINQETNNYVYTIKINRGTNDPEEIFNMRLAYETDILNILELLVNKFINSKYFLYTSFGIDDTNKVDKFYVNLMNDVEIVIKINSDKDLKTFQKINDKFKYKTVILSDNKEEVEKDEIQIEKAINKINSLKKTLDNLDEYNSIEDYDNIKPYILKVTNYYDIYKECFVYNFSIIRGTIKPTTFMSFRVNIKDNKIVYDKIYDLITHFKLKESFSIDGTINEKNPNYTINLKNNIKLQFDFNSELDREFYTRIKNIGTKITPSDKDNILKLTYNN